ncbi:MAG TPA: enoyl-[acyl-carrier-protein] reductase FabK [Acetomicrobium flavidum]|uniref:Enoyl-[acyl-carrier protein] reductase II n=2 Tax=Acetomicrobium TaxID=49894 RepID=A0ABY1JBJ8_9BACT|nr:enoyl-[acyl-carrier-protein] reductase FabK [Acetomicrobium mobile]NLG94466.1 enoyl-[acyl-carrier-protein] reductase FabK [Acetomicrobium flavidum]AFM21268.1 putative enoyl-(acyl-carrier-protein) reductase II [Acetomicrobium mobile DSM 13181]SIN63849.1 enoyl-[acyl-carrier protein] reductase II [Acetomicrobium flavidum]HOJ81693.1 enoyl-[acyl-carrier-protein] reductase FabK [Acetomicrobium flavidum]HOM30735.1 enoyl-[acyl-carrier-protein] reductase FabK [Acetomicrobium flavidum]
MWKRTRIQDLLNVEYPIIQGGMAWVANADLAAAVSNGGGLGVIAAGSMPPDLLDAEIKRLKQMTDKPFAVNIMLMSPTAEDAIEVVAENRVPVVTTGAGSPGKVIERLKPLGTIIIPVIASVAHAKRVERQGADAVVAEGTEAGGHIGELTTMVLVPQVVDAVSIPVVAAGGIADGRGVVAAFALGAEGVQVGTRFVCAAESPAHEAYKRAIIEATDRSTVVTGRSTGHPVRCIRNKLTKKFEELESSGASIEELEALGTGRLRAAVIDGDVEWGSVMAGQSAGLVKKVQPAAEIIRELFDDAERVLRKLGSHLTDQNCEKR